MNKIHERRLLKAANAVENADKYDQSRFFHQCGSPACVLGHYAAATKFKYFQRPKHYLFMFSDDTEQKAREHFGLSSRQFDAIFGSGGCGMAITGHDAAKYIRDFVKRKRKEP